jgi:Putative AphA-like transcriptional regulator
MAKDHSLLPADAIRLAALGFLAEAPRGYGELAGEIRDFIGLAVGPSLELMGSSIELLRHEGLAAAGTGEDADLTLTPDGAATLMKLLAAPLRAPNNDAGRLALLLKLRFGHHLPAAAQAAQRAAIADALGTELARLDQLRRRFGEGAPLFRRWLDRDIAELAARIDLFSGSR